MSCEFLIAILVAALIAMFIVIQYEDYKYEKELEEKGYYVIHISKW